MTDNERLSRELRDRAGHTGGHPISLDDVKRSANKMRWQQRAAAGAVAAVALAVAIPVGLSVAGDGGRGDEPSPIAKSPTVTESPTQTPTGPVETKEVVLTLDGAPRGGEPKVVYVYDNQIIEPDGTATDVAHNYSDVTYFGDGWIGIRIDDNGVSRADVLGADGSVVRSFRTSYQIAVSATDGEVASFEDTADGGVLTRYSADGEPEQTWDFADDVIVEPVGITSDGSVVYTTEGTDPVVMIAQADGGTQPVLGATNAGGVAPESGLVTGMVSYDEGVPESCWNLFDADGPVWPKERCDYTLGAFNDDETLMLGHPSYRDGIGDGLVSIIDVESGKALVEYNPPDNSFLSSDAVWEDATHVLAQVYSAEGWHIVRLDTEGNIENVTGAALPGEAEKSPVRFGARP